MLIILSPSKTLDESPINGDLPHSTPELLENSGRLITKLEKLSPKRVKALMGISDKLAKLNHQRFTDFSTPFSPENAKQAVLMFKGDVYEGLEVESFTRDDLEYAQKHLRILSGLYGILRPLDLIQPYRLEMGTQLKVNSKKNLYEFWGDRITENVNSSLEDQGDDILVNLASIEYYKALKPKKLNAIIITPEFKEERDGTYKMISFFAKKARGLLARYIISNQLSHAEDLQSFYLDGYRYNDELSGTSNPVFTRKQN